MHYSKLFKFNRLLWVEAGKLLKLPSLLCILFFLLFQGSCFDLSKLNLPDFGFKEFLFFSFNNIHTIKADPFNMKYFY